MNKKFAEVEACTDKQLGINVDTRIHIKSGQKINAREIKFMLSTLGSIQKDAHNPVPPAPLKQIMADSIPRCNTDAHM